MPLHLLQTIDKHLLEYVVRSGIAGGMAGSAAKTLVAPLDRIKILFQTSNPDFLQFRGTFNGLFRATYRIWKTDGLYGLFQGHSVTLIRVFPYAAIKFVAYEQIRLVLIPSDTYETALRRFLAGSLSGLSSVFLTYPLDLVRVRMAFNTHSSAQRVHLNTTIANILHETPASRVNDPRWIKYSRAVLPQALLRISNFYRGFAPTILGMVPYAGVSFYTHDLLQDMLRLPLLRAYSVMEKTLSRPKKTVASTKSGVSLRDARAPLRGYAQLFAGGIAGMFSQLAAYPFEVIRRRMQVGGAINQGQFLSFKHTARMIYCESGMRGYFVGLTIGYMKVVPMVACSFYVYERSKTLLGI